MRRLVSLLFATTLVVTGLAHSDSMPPVPRNMHGYVLVGMSALRLSTKNQVHMGDVGTDQSRAVLRLGNRVYFEDGTDVVGDTVRVGSSSRLCRLYSNSPSIGNGTRIDCGSQYGSIAFPLFQLSDYPPTPSFIPGSLSVLVRTHDNRVLDPGSYADIRAGSFATITLKPGTYDLANLNLGRNAMLLAQGPVTLRIWDRLTVSRFSELRNADSAPGLLAQDFKIYVGGMRASLSRPRTVRAHIYAPRAKMRVRAPGRFVGQFIAMNLAVSSGGADFVLSDVVCGNSKVEGGEQCDDGNATDGDGCDSNCTTTACGNGIKTASEQCDDGNMVDGDGCDSNCKTTGCGNGIKTGNEQCDDGNTVDGDTCEHDCKLPVCGNNIKDQGETCDGTALAGKTCVDQGYSGGTLACKGTCDGFVVTGCTTVCGNGVKEPGEACDDGNMVDGDGCEHNCTIPNCGNGIKESGEQCDDGANNSDTLPDHCRTDCKLPTCGDDVADAGEECDGTDLQGNTCGMSSADASFLNGDTSDALKCTASCKLDYLMCPANCGDGHLEQNEQCDDGNQIDGDTCDHNCTFPGCGNMVKDPDEVCDSDDLGGKTCHDFSYSGGTLMCSANCGSFNTSGCTTTCGNGMKEPGEACDDGNLTDGDGCEHDCTLPACGNGIKDAGEECDGGMGQAVCPGYSLPGGAQPSCTACKIDFTSCPPPPPVELPGDCIDNDNNGLVDFEDPAICDEQQSFLMALNKGRFLPRGAATKMRLKSQLALNSLASIDLRKQNVTLQVRPKGKADILCVNVPAERLKLSKSGRRLIFKDPKHQVASAKGLDRMVIKITKTGRVLFRAKGRRVNFQSPTAGDFQVTVGFRNPNASSQLNRCSTTMQSFRTQRRGLRAP